LFFLGLAAVLGGCGGPDFDDPETLDRILAEAVEKDELQGRDISDQDGTDIYYKKNQKTPYSGWMKSMYSNGQVESLVQLKEGLRHGESVEWVKSGQKFVKWNYKHGKKHGKFVRWHANGQKYVEGNYKDGKPYGEFEGWHESGEKSFEDEFKDGKRDGELEGWYENGQKSYRDEWKDGSLIDSVTWKPNGEKSSEVIDGNGLSVLWHESGQKSLETNWKDGRRHGTSSYWNEDGKLIRATTYKNGEKISEKEF
jgi:antitoxin component YwqK of YwqJK toxin-antitoxin module